MGGPRTRSAARLAGASAALVLAGVSAATAAGPGDSLRRQVSGLQARTHRAVLDLYALDARLRTVEARLRALEAQTVQLRREEELLGQQLEATRRTLHVSRIRLGENLRLLYKRGDVSTLAIVLGAQSLDDAVSQLDTLTSIADESKQVVAATAAAQDRLLNLRETLRERRKELGAAVAEAQHNAATLASTRAQRIAFISHLRTQQRLKVRQIAALQEAAARAERKSEQIQASVAPADPPDTTTAPATTTTETDTAESLPAAAEPGSRMLTVSSTGYSLPGHTSTGIPVGWGVVAVDPSVIPLGTKLTIPGYGDGVAADTGGGVRGSSIDLWFPTQAEARAWGRRTLTITLH